MDSDGSLRRRLAGCPRIRRPSLPVRAERHQRTGCPNLERQTNSRIAADRDEPRRASAPSYQARRSCRVERTFLVLRDISVGKLSTLPADPDQDEHERPIRVQAGSSRPASYGSLELTPDSVV